MTTVEQSLSALAHANEVRFARAEWRAELRGLGRAEAINRCLALLEVCPGWAARWPVESALLCIPKFGPMKVAAVMRNIRRSPTIEAMTARERAEVTERLCALREPVVA